MRSERMAGSRRLRDTGQLAAGSALKAPQDASPVAFGNRMEDQQVSSASDAPSGRSPAASERPVEVAEGVAGRSTAALQATSAPRPGGIEVAGDCGGRFRVRSRASSGRLGAPPAASPGLREMLGRSSGSSRLPLPAFDRFEGRAGTARPSVGEDTETRQSATIPRSPAARGDDQNRTGPPGERRLPASAPDLRILMWALVCEPDRMLDNRVEVPPREKWEKRHPARPRVGVPPDRERRRRAGGDRRREVPRQPRLDTSGPNRPDYRTGQNDGGHRGTNSSSDRSIPSSLLRCCARSTRCRIRWPRRLRLSGRR